MFENYCNIEEPELNIIGYKRIHPLEEKIFFNLNSDKYKSWEEIGNLFIDTSQYLNRKLKKLLNELENKKEFIKEIKSL